jgi:hypothetical protein
MGGVKVTGGVTDRWNPRSVRVVDFLPPGDLACVAVGLPGSVE